MILVSSIFIFRDEKARKHGETGQHGATNPRTEPRQKMKHQHDTKKKGSYPEKTKLTEKRVIRQGSKSRKKEKKDQKTLKQQANKTKVSVNLDRHGTATQRKKLKENLDVALRAATSHSVTPTLVICLHHSLHANNEVIHSPLHRFAVLRYRVISTTGFTFKETG